MEDQKLLKTDCNCEGDCCPPKKDKPWKKIVFFVTMLAAVSIVFIRLSSESKGKSMGTNDPINIQQATGADSTAVKDCSKTCDPSQNPSCCPQVKK